MFTRAHCKCYKHTPRVSSHTNRVKVLAIPMGQTGPEQGQSRHCRGILEGLQRDWVISRIRCKLRYIQVCMYIREVLQGFKICCTMDYCRCHSSFILGWCYYAVHNRLTWTWSPVIIRFQGAWIHVHKCNLDLVSNWCGHASSVTRVLFLMQFYILKPSNCNHRLLEVGSSNLLFTVQVLSVTLSSNRRLLKTAIKNGNSSTSPNPFFKW